MTLAIALLAASAAWCLVELARLRAARGARERARATAAVDAATGLLARRHGMVRFRVELRRARRAGRSIVVHELRGANAAVLDAIGTKLAPSITYPDVALRASPRHIVLLHSIARAVPAARANTTRATQLGCVVETRTVLPSDSAGFEQLERYADAIEAWGVEQ